MFNQEHQQEISDGMTSPPSGQQPFHLKSLMVSAYKEMTLRIFHSINFIKQLRDFEPIPEQSRIDFKFKKPGFDRLLIFDMDETLIHSLRTEEEDPDFDF